MSSDDNFIWPVGDLSCDDDEPESFDGVDLSIGASSGSALTIGSAGPSISAYSGHYTSKTYVEQQINEDGDPTVTIHGDLVIADIGGANEINVSDFMKTMKERMLILQPNFEAHEHYPALKDVYDQYKMLEKLLMEQNNDPEKKS